MAIALAVAATEKWYPPRPVGATEKWVYHLLSFASASIWYVLLGQRVFVLDGIAGGFHFGNLAS